MAAAASAMPCPPPPPPPPATAPTTSAAPTSYSPEAALKAAASTAAPPKHRPAKLGTPLSGTYPSLQSPKTSPAFSIKREDGSSSSSAQSYTPLTPPSAYLDFLKAMSPALTSPMSTSASAHFSFNAGPLSARTPTCGAWPSTACSEKFPQPPASARPTLSTFQSASSSASNKSTTSAPEPPARKTSITPPQASAAIPSSPAYPYPPPPPSRQSSTSSVASAAPSSQASASGPRPIRRPSVLIPESPSIQSPGIRSPASARDIHSPVPNSAALYSATPFSAGGCGNTSPVTVRQVVTRTVIYSSSPTVSSHPKSTQPADATKEIRQTSRHTPPHRVLVGDAPRGKRRRVE